MVKRNKISAIVILVLLIAVGGVLWFFATPRIIIPEPSLQHVEPQVAQKIERLQADVKKNPRSAALWGKMGMTLQVHGFQTEAIQSYDRAIELDQKDFRWPYYSAVILSEKEPAKSIDYFRKAIQLRPDYVPLRMRYGNVFFQMNKSEEAENQFRAVLSLDPNCAYAYTGLAQIALSRNDPNQAKMLSSKAIELQPQQQEPYALLAESCRRLNDTAAAVRAERQGANTEKNDLPDPVIAALASEGESAYWYRTRGRVYLQSHLYEMALREFQTALKLHPDGDAYDNIGVALQNIGRISEALEYHKKAIAMSGGYLAYFNLGIAYGKLQQYEDAIDAFRRSLRLKKDNAEAYYNLGIAYFKLSQWQLSEENLKQAINYNPGHAPAHYALAMAYLAQDKRTAASEEYEILKTLDAQLARRFDQRQ